MASPGSICASSGSAWATPSAYPTIRRSPLSCASRTVHGIDCGRAPSRGPRTRPLRLSQLCLYKHRMILLIVGSHIVAGLYGKKVLARFTGPGLAANNVKSSCADLFRVSASLFQPLQGVDAHGSSPWAGGPRHEAGQDEIGGAMFLLSSLQDFPRIALHVMAIR